MSTVRMLSRYRGKCSKCAGGFPVDTEIFYDRDAKTAAHATCPAVNLAIVRKSVEPLYDELALVDAELELLGKALTELEDETSNLAAFDFYTRGGCPKCDGTGHVLTWSTMDGDCYDEFSRCGCLPEALVKLGRGYKPGKYGGNKDVFTDYPYAAVARAILTEKMTPLNEKRAELSEVLTVKRGAVVEVVRGRKVPKGTKGVVIWIGDGRFGTRVGVKDDAETVHWTALSNVAVSEYETFAEAA